MQVPSYERFHLLPLFIQSFSFSVFVSSLATLLSARKVSSKGEPHAPTPLSDGTDLSSPSTAFALGVSRRAFRAPSRAVLTPTGIRSSAFAGSFASCRDRPTSVQFAETSPTTLASLLVNTSFALSGESLLFLLSPTSADEIEPISIEEQVEEKGCCAVCRLQLYPTDLIEGESASESASIADEAEVLERQRVEGAVATSAKTAQLIKFLQATEEGVKSLVFSQVSAFHLFCATSAD